MKILAALALTIIGTVNAWNNGLGATPPMGWNTERVFGNTVTEDIVKDTAQFMIRTGLSKAGYTYMNLGDGW